MINTRYIKIVALGLLLSASACEVLDVEPQASLPAETAFTTRTGVEAGLIGAYSSLQSGNYQGLRYWLFSDLATNNVSHTGTFPSFAQIEQNSILADNVEISNMWNTIYNGINRVNTLIAAIPNIQDPAFNNNAALGEARFLRAYHYFNLINYFGGSPTGYGMANGVGVPLVLTPTLTAADAEPKARASEAEVIAQVYQDLDFAIENLTNTSNARATKAGALALKSRVALYQRDYVNAAEFAKQALEIKNALAANYADIFKLRNTAESIWELQFDPVNSNSIAFFWFPTRLGGRNEVSPDAGLAGAHEAGDLRRPVNISTTRPDGEVVTGVTAKYDRIASSDDNVLLIRVAEVILNRAEALARIGGAENEAEARTLLNRIRTRAGLPAVAAELSGQALIDAILKERRIELAHEGHRWFDLRRTNSTGLTDANMNLWPIPQREVLTSGGVIEQNEGY